MHIVLLCYPFVILRQTENAVELIIRKLFDLNCQSKVPSFILPAFDRCTVTGEPHYTTFSQCPFDYQGVCKHLLATTTSAYSGSNTFTIYLRNQRKYRTSNVAFVLYVETVLKSDIIRMTRDLTAGCQAIAPVIVTVRNFFTASIFSQNKLFLKH